MTTENQEVNTQVENTEPQYSEIEQRAIEMGWRPKDAFDGVDEDFVDAKEFISRKPLYDRISQQSKQIKNVTKALEAIKEHYTKVNEAAYERAMVDLRAQRKEALLQGDGDALDRVEDQIKKAEREFDEIRADAKKPVVEDEPVYSPVFVEWKRRNSWYDSNSYMRQFADDEGLRLHKAGMNPDQVLVEVEKAVRKEFPNKFVNPNKSNAPDVSSSKGTGSGRSQEYKMTEDELRVWQTLHRTDPKLFSKEKYIEDLKKVKGA